MYETLSHNLIRRNIRSPVRSVGIGENDNQLRQKYKIRQTR